MKKSIIFILGIALLPHGLPAADAADATAPGEILKQMINFNRWIYSTKTAYPDFGTIEYRQDIERAWRMFESTFSKLKVKEQFGIFVDAAQSPKIAADKINIDKRNIKGNARIHLSPLYEINDDFKDLLCIFKMGFNVYFLMNSSITRQKKTFNGIFRIDEEKWYDLVTGTKFDFAVDLGKNRVIGYYQAKPTELFGFNWSFLNEFSVPLPDFRFRQGLYKLSDSKFLFHNARLTPGDYAVEIYDMSGKRTMECFDFAPNGFKTSHNILFAIQTVLTTDQKGNFYIGFQYPLNPYMIWKYAENGSKQTVMGNYFEDPDIYEFPEEWLTGSLTDIEYYGIDRLYSVDKLLTDSRGRLFVFFSLNRIPRKHRGNDVHEYYIDIYSETGEFLGRTGYKYGFPDLIDNDVIYSRRQDPSGSWKITAVRINID